MAPWNPVYRGLKAHQILEEISTGIYIMSRAVHVCIIFPHQPLNCNQLLKFVRTHTHTHHGIWVMLRKCLRVYITNDPWQRFALGKIFNHHSFDSHKIHKQQNRIYIQLFTELTRRSSPSQTTSFGHSVTLQREVKRSKRSHISHQTGWSYRLGWDICFCTAQSHALRHHRCKPLGQVQRSIISRTDANPSVTDKCTKQKNHVKGPCSARTCKNMQELYQISTQWLSPLHFTFWQSDVPWQLRLPASLRCIVAPEWNKNLAWCRHMPQ